MSQVIVQLTIRGRVQGVGYRAWVEYQAIRRGLDGWVRNRTDGSVEAVFAGAADVVAEMVEQCRRGPSSARVEAVTDVRVDAEALKLRRAGERFSVLPTL